MGPIYDDEFEPRECEDCKEYRALIKELVEALEVADQFITNGVENGYIRLPDPPDTALQTPGIIRAALAKAKKVTG